MASIPESQLSNWTKPASDSEDARRERTEKAIRKAIKDSAFLSTLPIRVYAKGSYKNNTNVRLASDVDIAVEYEGIIHPDYRDGTTEEDVRRYEGSGPYSGPFVDNYGNTAMGQFKDAVGEALVNEFGSGAITRSNKVFTVREASQHLAADVVPCSTDRTYFSPQNFQQGIRLIPDRSPGHPVQNYPEQHFQNGVEKNKNTYLRFKSVVRILKNLRNHKKDEYPLLDVPSYLIECLVYNVPNTVFLADDWGARTRSALIHIWEDTEEAECEKRWMEVNDFKYLFHSYQKWNREQAREFVKAAWNHVKS